MDNQHREIKGYRELTQEELDLMNEIKNHAEETRKIVEKLLGGEHINKRWVNIGQTDLQKGYMALVRAVAQPSSF